GAGARAAGARGPRHSEHLTGPQLEAQRLGVGTELELARLEEDVFAWRRSRGSRPDVASDHQADQLVRRQAGNRSTGDDAPVLEHRRPVGKAKDLRQAVRDIEDAEAARPQLIYHLEHAIELRARPDRR